MVLIRVCRWNFFKKIMRFAARLFGSTRCNTVWKSRNMKIESTNIPSSMCSKASVYKRQSSSNAFFWVDAFMKWQVNPASCCKYCSNNWGCKFVKMEAGKKSMTLRMILEMPKASLAWKIENNIFHLINPYKIMYAQRRAYSWQVASFGVK